jgi:acyl-coenzyme A thioesterase PaaI-like protein
MNASVSTRLARMWGRLAPLPAGRWIFSRVFGWFVPYSGTIGARVEELAPGRAVVRLEDRRGIRNHLDSIHAVALINLGELTSGLAMTMALPPDVRGIVTALGARYEKKARGALTAIASVTVPPLGPVPVLHPVEAVITDAAGDLVCRVETTWKLARRDPNPPSGPDQ